MSKFIMFLPVLKLLLRMEGGRERQQHTEPFEDTKVTVHACMHCVL